MKENPLCRFCVHMPADWDSRVKAAARRQQLSVAGWLKLVIQAAVMAGVQKAEAGGVVVPAVAKVPPTPVPTPRSTPPVRIVASPVCLAIPDRPGDTWREDEYR